MSDLNLDEDDFNLDEPVTRHTISDLSGDNVGVFNKKPAIKEIRPENSFTNTSESRLPNGDQLHDDKMEEVNNFRHAINFEIKRENGAEVYSNNIPLDTPSHEEFSRNDKLSDESSNTMTTNGDSLRTETSNIVTNEEEEDIDELFRVEMENMRRESSRTIDSVRQLSLSDSLDTVTSAAAASAEAGMTRSKSLTGTMNHSSSRQAPPSSMSLFRNWSISAYRYTWQPLSERFGFGRSSSANATLQARAASLTEARADCVRIANIASAMATHLDGVVRCQRGLAREFLRLSIESPGLSKEFLCNAEVNDAVQKNGALLVDALRAFVAGIETLCNKTIDDTLDAVKKCEAARLEYDTYVWGLGTRSISSANQQQLDEKRETYEKLLKHIEVKLQLIEGNRIAVLRRQLIIFRNALSAYFSGNRTALESIMKSVADKPAVLPSSGSKTLAS